MGFRSGLVMLLLIASAVPIAAAGASGTIGCKGQKTTIRTALAVWDEAEGRLELLLFARRLSAAEQRYGRTLPFPWTMGEGPAARMTLWLDLEKSGNERLQGYDLALPSTSCAGSGVGLRRDVSEAESPEEFYQGLIGWQVDPRDRGKLTFQWKRTARVVQGTELSWDLRVDATIRTKQK